MRHTIPQLLYFTLSPASYLDYFLCFFLHPSFIVAPNTSHNTAFFLSILDYSEGKKTH